VLVSHNFPSLCLGWCVLVIWQCTDCCLTVVAFCAALLGIELLIEYYQHEGNTKELPCRLESPCAGGLPPPPLSLSCGYTNVLHKAISTGISDVSALHLFVIRMHM